MGYYASTCPACGSPCVFFSAGMYYDCDGCRRENIARDLEAALAKRRGAREQPWSGR